MLLFVSTLLLGWLIGFLRGGRTPVMRQMRFRFLPLFALVVAIFGALSLQGITGAVATAMQLAGYAGVLAWLIVNARVGQSGLRLGFAVAAIGWALNTVVIVPNHGMPVSPAASAPAHVSPDTGASASTGRPQRHVVEHDGTWARPLGDTIPVPAFRLVLSPGDVVILAGISLIVAGGMTIVEPSRRARVEP